MQERNVILTWEAIYDILDIVDYIEDWFGLDRANQFQEDIDKQTQDLGDKHITYGQIGIFYRNYPIYKKLFSPSVIFYIVKEPENEVHVLRVLREESNWKKTLQQTKQYTYPQ